MIRSTFAGFNTAVLGLSASQRALDVTGQNLSNINTQGYTRQRLDQYSLNPPGVSLANSVYSNKVGQGVMMNGVSQIRDPFLDIQYRNQLPKVGTADAMDSILAKIGQIFDETDKDAVAVQFNAIISELQSLSQAGNAGTDSSDMVVRSACEVLLNTIRQNGIEVQDVYDELKTKLDTNVVPDINGYLKDIVEKNIAIKNTQVLGNPGLELMDTRNEMIDSLATYFPIEVSYEKQNLGGGIVVDILNIDLKLEGGQKVRIVSDNMCGEVGIAKNDDGTVKDQPVEFYVKSAGENPKTYGGGLEVLKTELPNEINGYIDDIAELNEKIKQTNDKIEALERVIANTTSEIADDHQDKINGYIDSIATLNKTVTDRTAEMANLNTQIADKNTQISNLQESFRNAATVDERQRIRAQIETAQSDLKRLNSELNTKQNERTVAESQRTQALNRLKEYFPTDTIASSIGADRVMTVSVTTATDNGVLGTSILVSRDATGADITGEITGVNTATDPISYAIDGAGNSQDGTASASNKIQQDIDSATADTQKQIKELQARIPQYVKDRQTKVDELQEYFPDNTITTETDADNIMTVYLSAAGAADPAAGDLVLVSGGAKGNVSYDVNSGQLDVTGSNGSTETVNVSTAAVDRIMGSINDRLQEGVVKGDLDMLNKSEIFDVDIANGVAASDIKGIQYYQKMLDSFVNEFATVMNELNMVEEVPLVDKDGNPVMGIVDGKEQQLTEKVLRPKNALFTTTDETSVALMYKDPDGNWTTEATHKDATTGQDVPNDPLMAPELDKDGNVRLDDDGNVIYSTEQATIPVNFTSQNIKVSDSWMGGDTKINTKRQPLAGGNSSDNWNVDRMIDVLSKQTHSFTNPDSSKDSGEVFKGTLYECYTSIQGAQAVDRKATAQVLETRTIALDQIADDKDSVSGVWMDEEVMSLMKYSQSYNAASRLMTVMDEVLERLITGTGVCGR